MQPQLGFPVRATAIVVLLSACAGPAPREATGEAPAPATPPATAEASAGPPASSSTATSQANDAGPSSASEVTGTDLGHVVATNASANAEPAASTAPTDDDAPPPRELTPEFARGICKSRAVLETRKGEVSCYPFRCRNDRCLLSCKTRKDCAGSDGPADLEENGWPLDCRSSRGECVPLPPRHVN